MRNLRAILSDQQKKKLDQFEHGPHSVMQRNLSGATAAERSAKP
jgi:hypothetical protein